MANTFDLTAKPDVTYSAAITHRFVYECAKCCDVRITSTQVVLSRVGSITEFPPFPADAVVEHVGARENPGGGPPLVTLTLKFPGGFTPAGS